jgi:hypothetical protein
MRMSMLRVSMIMRLMMTTWLFNTPMATVMAWEIITGATRVTSTMIPRMSMMVLRVKFFSKRLYFDSRLLDSFRHGTAHQKFSLHLIDYTPR